VQNNDIEAIVWLKGSPVMTTKSSSFGTLLRYYRKAVGLSQETLAERAGISVRDVSAIEQGVIRAPQKHTVDRLADALKLPADDCVALEMKATASRRRGTRSVEALTSTVAPYTCACRQCADEGKQSNGAPAWPRAKVSPPQPQSLVSRPRLLETLSFAITPGNMSFVVAPGGSGKTLLVADWARQARMPVAWYALDAADRDPRYLVEGLCVAVERTLPGTTHAARTTLSTKAPDITALSFLLGALEDQPLALVLDDFQHLDGALEALALWDHLLRSRPPSLALVIVSRSIPQLGFAGLKGLDRAVGLGSEDLRFDAVEAGKLLSAHGFDARQAARLVAYCGGWAAGVLLLGYTRPGHVRFLRDCSKALMGQLGAEIIAALPPDLRVFLLESAALGPATSEDADAILDRRDSAALYVEVLARGLFLEQDDTLYRYHNLFAEYLVDMLKTENPRRLCLIRRAAATRWPACGNATGS